MALTPLSEVVLAGEAGRSRARGDVERAEDRAEVHLDGVGADDQPVGDLLVGQPLRDKPQHLDFALAQSGRVGGSRGPVTSGR